tara:strand:- start:104 stop:394 length:291 start_codon:yes stop_codon:yes gene_type:complete
MKVDNTLIQNLASLSKLDFNESDLQKIKVDLENIFEFVKVLEKVNTDNVEPLIYMSDETNVIRNDEITTQVSKTDALKNAPSKNSDYFKVPTVLKK